MRWPWQKRSQPWAIAGAIVLSALILTLALKDRKEEMPEGPGETVPPAAQGEAPAPAAPAQGGGTDVRAAMTYTAAVKKYGTNRLQLDENCQAQPINLTFKAGTAVMIDNRSDNTRAVAVGTRNYTIQPWGWAVVGMPMVKAQTRLLVDCDALENVATFLVQP